MVFKKKQKQEENVFLKTDEKGDVGFYSDLLSFLINISATEIHSNMSYIVENDPKWIKYTNKFRTMRTKYQKLMVEKSDDQKWCVSKHLFIMIMNLIELGNRFAEDKLEKQAGECYKDAGNLIEMLFELNDIGGK